jgi:predicted metallo-beta-lactamase superfamily hydrolase
MVTKMRVIPLASESLGVRSLATFVKASGIKILIDPGVALGPKRYGLPPAEMELKTLQQMRKKLQGYARKADIITHLVLCFLHLTNSNFLHCAGNFLGIPNTGNLNFYFLAIGH